MQGGVPSGQAGVLSGQGGIAAVRGGVPSGQGGVLSGQGGIAIVQGGVPSGQGGVLKLQRQYGQASRKVIRYGDRVFCTHIGGNGMVIWVGGGWVGICTGVPGEGD